MKRAVARVLAATFAAAWTLAITAAPGSAAPRLLSNAQPSASTGEESVMLVVDTSGSMNDRDGSTQNVVKLEGAKTALLNFLDAAPLDTHVSLLTYPTSGNTPQIDGCNTGQLFIPGQSSSPVWPVPATLPLPPKLSSSRSQLEAEIRSLSADGDTPTSAALRYAADVLKAQGGADTIVLVSDGESNCGADPCDVAKAIASEGIDLTVDTLGFQISPAGRDQLTCIADATHGRYFDVADSQQLAADYQKLTHPLLDVRISNQAQVPAVSLLGNTGPAPIHVTVTNNGTVPASNVVVSLSFDGAQPGATGPAGSQVGYTAAYSPVRHLGNLAPATTRTEDFTFRPPILDHDVDLPFTVDAVAAGTQPVEKKGQLILQAVSTVSDAGPLLTAAHHVVVLGDSYSAGEGGGQYEADTNTYDNGCHRSPNTYAKALYAKSPGVRVDIVACSGAITADISEPSTANRDPTNSNSSNPSQVDQLRRVIAAHGRPDLMLMTSGGNDIAFAEIIMACLLPGNCATLTLQQLMDDISAAASAGGAGAQMASTVAQLISLYGPKETFGDFIRSKINDLLDTELQQAYEASEATVGIGPRGEAAPLIVLGYPDPYPYVPVDKCPEWLGLSSNDIAFVHQIVQKLNDLIAKATVEARDSSGWPIYFDPFSESAFHPDHTLCDTNSDLNKAQGKKLLEGLAGKGKSLLGDALYLVPFVGSDLGNALRGSVTRDLYQPGDRSYQETFHPNPAGYLAMAASLVRFSLTSDGSAAAKRVRGPARDEISVPPGFGEPGPSGIPLGPSATVALQGGASSEVLVPNVAPGSEVTITLSSQPTVVGRGRADASGRATIVVTIPPGTPSGSHHLIVGAIDQAGEPFGYVRPAGISYPKHWGVLEGFGGGGTACLAGAALFMLSRRRLKKPG